MRIVMAASEMTPYAKTGGLGDVLGALPFALGQRGHQVSVFIPFHRGIRPESRDRLLEFQLRMGGQMVTFALLRIVRRDGVTVYAIQKDEYFDRAYLYGPTDQEYADNAERFVFFNQAVLHCIRALGLDPQIVHTHDWHTALIPLHLRLARGTLFPAHTRTVFTIHNLAYQGRFPAHQFRFANLPGHLFAIEGIEFYGQMNLMKGGILFADAVTTVSQRYAREIQTPEFGHDLDGVLRSRDGTIHGIVNGVDYSIWNPATDPQIARPYKAGSLTGKNACRKALLAEFHLRPSDKGPILGIISRFTHQKGLDLVLGAMAALLQTGARLVILGSGELAYEEGFRGWAARHPQQVALRLGFDDALAHRIYAGSDFFLMPSRYEPCGLGQLYAMRYGSIPVVRATGGLDDTVQEWDAVMGRGNGFKFSEPLSHALLAAFRHGLRAHRQPAMLRALRRNAMTADFSWDQSAARYEKLYQSL